MKRFGQVIGIDQSRIDEYTKYHSEIWPEISAALEKAGVRNYSIFHHRDLLFAYFEYHGPDAEFEERMAAIADAPRMKEWWEVVGGLQRPLEDRAQGEFWKELPSVFTWSPAEDEPKGRA